MQETTEYLRHHHGGDGQKAAEKTVQSYAKNHDADFQAFWQHHCAAHLSDQASVIDLGCGTGLWLNQLAQQYPHATLTGFELAPYMLERMEDLAANVNIICDDLNNPATELPQHSVDIALANLLIHELHQPVTLFSKLRRWLKPGGVLVLCDMVRQPLADYLQHQYSGIDLASQTPDYDALVDAFQHFQEHNRYHPEDITALLRQCGFEISAAETFKNGRAVRIAAISV
ncbi:Ubiquinone/menaquinone biosynthesis C-methylase UbiE [Amphritea atlantica]|uniref:Ubiquinone/menaquinone biosynthesis C-methylase UbiE n=1 Tax=Amphritea atlantica TaxID=355243 RepID=A0A1H9GI06_9GAMM|nr:class I SAM-dependent methyltransferase [Amphritea atlantica]SEQ49689.1 Ubiquinone/menaquinone biosynthesis C-methylase UbiE [Amphritea atlantica]